MIDVTNLCKSFGDKRVLDGLSFGVEQGSVFGLLGPNGSGKTTTINILCNLLDADAGTAAISGHHISQNTRSAMGVAPQEIALYKDLTCRENLFFFARIYGVPTSRISGQCDALIQTFKLEDYANTPVSKLSGGWQRRVNMAVALVHSPTTLILDEPTAGLDIEARYEIWELIATLSDTNVTILLTTHQLEEAEKLCSRIGILNRGKITAEGTITELRKMVPAQQIAQVETGDANVLYERLTALGWEYRTYGGRLSLLLPEQFTLNKVIADLDGIPLTSISLMPVGLEHVYLEVTNATC